MGNHQTAGVRQVNKGYQGVAKYTTIYLEQYLYRSFLGMPKYAEEIDIYIKQNPVPAEPTQIYIWHCQVEGNFETRVGARQAPQLTPIRV
jgi:hypothetical protein